MTALIAGWVLRRAWIDPASFERLLRRDPTGWFGSKPPVRSGDGNGCKPSEADLPVI
jgi:hypothetical protein